jgi:hypothetical protein
MAALDSIDRVMLLIFSIDHNPSHLPSRQSMRERCPLVIRILGEGKAPPGGARPCGEVAAVWAYDIAAGRLVRSPQYVAPFQQKVG